MSPSKKKKRPEAAQQLIDSLLDESSSGSTAHTLKAAPKPTPKKNEPVGENTDDNFAVFNFEGGDGDELNQFAPVSYGDSEPSRPVIEMLEEPAQNLSLEDEEDSYKPKPPFQGGSPVVTQMAAGRPEPMPFDVDDSDDVVGDGSPEEERTVRLVVSNPAPQPTAAKPAMKSPPPVAEPVVEDKATRSVIDRHEPTEIRSGIRVPPPPKPASTSGSAGIFTSSDASLKQSESLRIAQVRITELEGELERVRRENESLSTAGDTLRRRTDELLSKAESLEIQAREATHMLDEEKKIMRGQLQAKERENSDMRARVEEIETRLESNFKKIRVRERELEHRLEIVKMESTTLVSTKDKMILELKRQIDQLNHEHDYAKTKTQELFKQYKDKQETQRRVVRALRIALTILEGDDDSMAPMKKAD